MLFNKSKIFLTFALLLTLFCTFAHAEKRLMSAIEGNWKLEKLRVKSTEIEVADSGYLTIFANKEVSYQGVCKSYIGEMLTSNRETRKRSDKRGRSYRFKAGFKLKEIAGEFIACLGLDEFEAYSNKIFRARFLNRQNGTLKLRYKRTVFTFRKL